MLPEICCSHHIQVVPVRETTTDTADTLCRLDNTDHGRKLIFKKSLPTNYKLQNGRTRSNISLLATSFVLCSRPKTCDEDVISYQYYQIYFVSKFWNLETSFGYSTVCRLTLGSLLFWLFYSLSCDHVGSLLRMTPVCDENSIRNEVLQIGR